jgi:hypothetical protein
VVRATGKAMVLGGRVHLILKYKIVYTSDPPPRINSDRILLS